MGLAVLRISEPGKPRGEREYMAGLKSVELPEAGESDQAMSKGSACTPRLCPFIKYRNFPADLVSEDLPGSRLDVYA